jgi:hypothetical protein
MPREELPDIRLTREWREASRALCDADTVLEHYREVFRQMTWRVALKQRGWQRHDRTSSTTGKHTELWHPPWRPAVGTAPLSVGLWTAAKREGLYQPKQAKHCTGTRLVLKKG